MRTGEFPNAAIGGAENVTVARTVPVVLNAEEHASAIPDSTSTGFPKQSGQSVSYWLQQVRNDPLLDHRTSDDLPKEADTVVIGSGISGTLITKHLLQTRPSKSVVVLEAREFCSGATGRNAGHCKPDQWRHYAKFEKAYGREQALKIMDNEAETWKALVTYVRQNDVDCDLWVGDTLDVTIDEDVTKAAEEVFEKYKRDGGKVDHIRVIREPAKAEELSRIKGARSCYSWKASTLQPWKLTAHIMRENIQQGANLQTYTLAKCVEQDSSGDREWLIHTSRGVVACDTVVHATNAYCAALEPSFKGAITPKPHICNRVVPPRSLSGSRAVQNSYGVLLPHGAIFSINPRCSADGNIMFGGSNIGQKRLDEWVKQNPEHNTDDGFANVEHVTKEVREFVERNLQGWNDSELGPGEGFQYSWSGIIGLSTDGVPYVGEIPGKPGQWICAGHHGHGMARIFTAAPGLVKLMNGETWSTTGLPEVYHLTQQRLQNISKAPQVAVI